METTWMGFGVAQGGDAGVESRKEFLYSNPCHLGDEPFVTTVLKSPSAIASHFPLPSLMPPTPR